ncbi:hypothetical protein A33M_1623 [Rhodovulum sp. PH10]|uniref:hypothetical protein n=1 Tax=Rhodovulum sp. PH10 TaxID=1187851 RepID=UPI00027C212E|nr:hypothetical protein [Rhodovulum sp. PH10]EJW09329.1 hypothetical protein A33M_1623 [Rhodovulum sp. PH10]
MRDTLSYHFEELPVFRGRDDDTVAGMVSGWAEITYTGPHDWGVIAIVLDGHNGKIGWEAESRRVHLDQRVDAYLWRTICEGLEDEADRIAEKIIDRMDDLAASRGADAAWEARV